MGRQASSGGGTAPTHKGRRGEGRGRRRFVVTLVLLLAHLSGLACSIHALMSVRTPQGTIAWIVSLNTFPYVTVPAYLFFGRSSFHGYVVARRQLEVQTDASLSSDLTAFSPFIVEPGKELGGARGAMRLAELPILRGNDLELLIDGRRTFDSIFAGIEAAREYVLVQFYIVRDDDLGRELKERLLRKAAEGVRVYFLYDRVGSYQLSSAFVSELRDGGVNVSAFHSTRGRGNRFQLNFRNHRKIVVVDGRLGWTGGHNVGVEYLGRDPDFGAWRDTHVRIEGPAALGLQVAFVEDWRWAADELLDLGWRPQPAVDGDVEILILASGPADPVETASLMFQLAIHEARQRVWIASPYFVPDRAVMSALQLASLRGVNVRILIPDHPDHLLVYLSAFAFVGEMLEAGVEIYRYEPGFLHQKVLLVDDSVSFVGTANLDNRSFRLNFEITTIVADRAFAAEVEQMLVADFARARRMTLDELRAKPFWFKAAARAAHLMAPIQ